MARRNISLPDDLDERARKIGLNVSALAQRAIADELERRERMAGLRAWLDELDERYGAVPEEMLAEARAWHGSARPVRPREELLAAAEGESAARRAAG